MSNQTTSSPRAVRTSVCVPPRQIRRVRRRRTGGGDERGGGATPAATAAKIHPTSSPRRRRIRRRCRAPPSPARTASYIPWTPPRRAFRGVASALALVARSREFRARRRVQEGIRNLRHFLLGAAAASQCSPRVPRSAPWPPDASLRGDRSRPRGVAIGRRAPRVRRPRPTRATRRNRRRRRRLDARAPRATQTQTTRCSGGVSRGRRWTRWIARRARPRRPWTRARARGS